MLRGIMAPTEELQNSITEIESSMLPLDQTQRVYRGTTVWDNKLFSTLESGHELALVAFTSTSRDPAIALRFMGASGGTAFFDLQASPRYKASLLYQRKKHL